MEDLRTEVDRLRTTTESMRSSNESLRSENTRLSSAIQELQRQNAQLIEDHTRDVLSIKAKETQLARARTESEEAHIKADDLQRDVERLRRDLSRVNQAPPSDAPSSQANPDHISATPAYRARRPIDTPQTTTAHAFPAETPSNFTPAAISSFTLPTRSRTIPASPPPPEGKENHALHAGDDDVREKALSPPRPAGIPRSTAAPGANSPARLPLPRPTSRVGAPPSLRASATTAVTGGARTAAAAASAAATSTTTTAGGDAVAGVESWKRAAEVTQNLKARIEMMKVSFMGSSLSSCPLILVWHVLTRPLRRRETRLCRGDGWRFDRWFFFSGRTLLVLLLRGHME